MKLNTLGITTAIACVSLYVFAEYKPTFSALQRKIIREINQVADLLREGTKLVLTGEQSQKRIAEKRQERDLAAKRALERQKNLSSKGKTGGYGGSGGGYGRNHYGGGSYNPYAGGGRPYGGGGYSGGGYGGGGGYRSPYAHMGYDDDYDDYDNHHGTKPSTTTPVNTPDENKSGGGVDLKAQEEAKKLEQERAQADNELIEAAQKIASAVSGITDPGKYDAKIQGLMGDDAFADLASAASTHRTNVKKATTPAPTPTAANNGTKTTPTVPKSAGAKASPLDSKIASLYRQILPHLIYAATRDTDASPDAARALKTDVKQVLGHNVVDQEVKKRADAIIAKWKKETEYENEMKVFKLVKNGVAGNAFNAPAKQTRISKEIMATRAPAAGNPTNEEAKATYKKHFELYQKDLLAKKTQFKSFASQAALDDAFKTEINGCNEIIDQQP